MVLDQCGGWRGGERWIERRQILTMCRQDLCTAVGCEQRCIPSSLALEAERMALSLAKMAKTQRGNLYEDEDFV